VDFRSLDRTLVIAEIGVNHEGDFDVAADLIRKAADVGADYVKFQTFSIQHYISTEQPERYERTSRFELSREQFRRLANVAADSGVTFISTPFHMVDADFLDEIVPLFKISSGDLTFLSLVRHVAKKRKPMIISTGLGAEQEIADAVQAVREEWPEAIEQGQVMLMHCVSAYPTSPEEANLRNIEWLRHKFDVPVGYSDHTLGVKACELAVAMGARVIEKHFTYRKEDQAFHDHLLSADPQDLHELITAIRHAETYLGSAERLRGETEQNMEQHMRRSIGALVDIEAGVPVEEAWLTYVRPQWGLKPDEIDQVIGKPLKNKISAGAVIRKEDLE